MQLVRRQPLDAAVKLLVERIGQALEKGEQVAWFVSGGSAIAVAVTVSTRLPASQRLQVLQVDERYGLPNHPDANWRRLREAGFAADKFHCWPVLGDRDLAGSTEAYDQLVATMLGESQLRVGLFGIGDDGHTAGLLPGSSALNSEQFVASFQGPDYQRITMTAAAINRLDLAVAYAVGDSKRPALNDLLQDQSFRWQPAQALKLADESFVFNDQLEAAV